MDDAAAKKQIAQMCAFILQEAREKANEIAIKTEEEFELDKTVTVHNGKLKINEDFDKKEKHLEVQQRILRSSAISGQRKRKLIARNDMINSLINEVKKRLAATTENKEAYMDVMIGLIVQAMISLNETNYVVRVREVDLDIARIASVQALQQYKDLLQKKETGKVAEITVTVAEDPRFFLAPPPSSGKAVTCSGGVVVSCYGNKILCDNTLDSRVTLAYEELKPVIRRLLFPSSVRVVSHGAAGREAEEQ